MGFGLLWAGCEVGDEHDRGECELKGERVEYIPGGGVGDDVASSEDTGGG